MSDDPNIIDELEHRLIATFYEKAPQRESRRVHRRWVPAAGSLAALALIAAVVILVLAPGTVNPPTALAALERAADAAAGTPTPALGPGKVWSAQIIRTSAFGQTVPSDPSRTVPMTVRELSTVLITQSGRLTNRTVYTYSFVHPGDAALLGHLFSTPLRNTTTTAGHGKLASPLLPTAPLLSYNALRALPDQTAQLRRVIARLIRGMFPQQAAGSATSTTASTTASQTSTSGGDVIVVGTCRGTSAQDHNAVRTMNMVAWLLALPVRPAVRAALYRTAATLPGVRYDGTVRDALGRTGIEISVGSGDDQLRMIFNEHTSALLAISNGFGKSALRKGFGTETQTLQSATVQASTRSSQH